MKKTNQSTRVDNWQHENFDDLETFEKIHRSRLALMPTSKERYAKHAAHRTEGSRRANRRVSQLCGGFHQRKRKPIQ